MKTKMQDGRKSAAGWWQVRLLAERYLAQLLARGFTVPRYRDGTLEAR